MGTTHDHYFTAQPASADERRPLRVRLADQDLTVEVAGGVFSPGEVDQGTAVLLAAAPRPATSGTFLDLGCGWGPIALTLGLLAPSAQTYAVDVNERALDLTRRNATALGLESLIATTPDGIPEEVRFDLIWSNPPIRVGKVALHALLAQWLPRLTPAGVAYLVVAKNLGADSLQRWITAELDLRCERITSESGFRVLAVSREG